MIHTAITIIATGMCCYIMWQTFKPNQIAASRWRIIETLQAAGGVTTIGRTCITVVAEWTSFRERVYTGATVDVSLAQALADMERRI